MGDDDFCDKVTETSSTVLMIILPILIGIFLIVMCVRVFSYFETTGMHYTNAKMLFSQSFIAIIMFCIVGFAVSKHEYPCRTFAQFINNGDISVSSVFVGFGSNIVFGFIDNAGLFFGGCYLEEVFSLLPAANDANVAAGYGNTFSDFLGAFLGTFAGKMLEDISKISASPLWSEALGIIIGCLFGILIPKLLLSNSQTKGLNKIAASTVILGNMEDDELEAIVKDNVTVCQFRAQRIFDKLDFDKSGQLEQAEIREYLMKAMGDDWNEDQFNKDMNTVFNVSFDDKPDQINREEWHSIYKKMAEKLLEEKKPYFMRKKSTIKEQKLNLNISNEQKKQNDQNINDSTDKVNNTLDQNL